MRQKTYTLVLACLMAVATSFAGSPLAVLEPHRVDVTFSHTDNTPAGSAVFVLGNYPELGANNITRAIKLEPTDFPNWEVTISLPAEADYEFRFLRRDLDPEQLANPSNATFLTALDTDTAPPVLDPQPTRSVYVRPPTAYTSIAIVDPDDIIRTNVALSNDGTYMSATNLPLFAGDRVRFLRPLGQFDDRLTDAPQLFVTGDLGFASWHPIPAGTPSIPRFDFYPNFASPELGNTRRIRVYLPRGYDSSPLLRYPVLYAHDGQNVFHGGNFDGLHADTTIDNLAAQGIIPHTIVVAMDFTLDRFGEYAPPGKTVLGYTGKGDLYAQFVAETVAPFIDGTYRTLADRDHRIVSGPSMGGVISSYMAYERPDFAKRYIVISPAWYETPSMFSRFTMTPASDVIMWIDNGNDGDPLLPSWPDSADDGLPTVLDAYDVLANQGSWTVNGNLFLYIGFGHLHNEFYWRQRFPLALRALHSGPALHLLGPGSGPSAAATWHLYD